MPLEQLLRQARRRLWVRYALRGLGVALAVVGIGSVALRFAGVNGDWNAAVAGAISAVAVALLSHAWKPRQTRQAAAAAIEQGDGTLRNLIVTAEQLLTQPSLTAPVMRERVLEEASRRSGTVSLSRAVPLWRDAAWLLLGLSLAFLMSRTSAASLARPEISRFPDSPISRSSEFTVELIPPGYSGRQTTTVSAPAAIEALAGTRAVVQVTGAAGVRLRVNDHDVSSRDGIGTVVLAESGYLAVESPSFSRLVPLTVVPDRVPDVRIAAPGKDLRVPSAGATIPIRAEASDDLGLASFELRYTVVSGTGEQFTFTEGTLPASIVRTTDRNWRLEAPLSLTKLKLEPGDALIYRAVANDKRSGEAGLASSDTFFIEVAGPGDVPLEGVEMPPDKERYALSQAMIVLKIERLMAREKSMARDALVDAAGNIAAEQRAVRANFIFLLGG